MKKTALDLLTAAAITCALTLCALAYFDILTK